MFAGFFLPPGAGLDVLGYGHVGEQGVLLEQIADPPGLGRQVDACRLVEEDPAVQHDPALIGAQDAGDALEGHAFAAAGGPQQGQDLPGLRGERRR